MIDIIEDHNHADWLDYCTGKDSALFSHPQLLSRTLSSTYNLPAFFLLARSGPTHTISGILPLLLFAPPGGQKRLISLPYTDSAGILADSEEIQGQLLETALDLTETLGAAHLELRQHDRLAWAIPSDPWVYTEHSFKISLKRALPETTSELWETLPAKVRNQIRKAWNAGCVSHIGGGELLTDFYAVFSENMRDLGSPVHDFGLFQKALAINVPRAWCILISCRDIPAAGAIVFEHGRTLFNPWASSLRYFRPDCPNMLLYWTMLCHAVERDCRWFDFGRSSPGSSTARFKMQWGAEIHPLFWHVFSKQPHDWQPTHESLVNENWKKLPLDLSRQQGPALRRWISL